MKILLFGGGDIAEQGIIPVVGGISVPQHKCDVRIAHQVQLIMEEEKPNVVVACAGVSHVANIKNSSPGLWKDELLINLLGSYHVAKYAVENGVDKIIFIASLAGLFGKPNHSGYCASKAGVLSLMQSLCMENYNAYAISPGRVHTRMRERDYPGEDVKTRLDPKEIGYIVSDILNDKYKSGDNIIIRMRGYDILPIVADRNAEWQEKLRVVPNPKE